MGYIKILLVLILALITAMGLYSRRKKEREKFRANKKKYVLQFTAVLVVASLVCGVGMTLFANQASSADEAVDNSCWHMKVINASAVQAYGKGEGQAIAFLDTGISDELAERYDEHILATYNAVTGGEDVTDSQGHGTEMVSIACGDGSEGVYGLAPEADVLVAKIADKNGRATNETLLKGLAWAEKQGATVVNISLGGHKASKKVIARIAEMNEKNITIVVASGDNSDEDLLFPASEPDVISVAALQGDSSLWPESNRSKMLTCAFPGYEIACLAPSENGLVKETDSGTSEACAVASSYIAIYREYSNRVSHYDIVKMLASLKTLSGKEADYVAPFDDLEE